MEELISTEALEREILEDARKKAERLLRGADEEVRRAAETGQRRKAESAAELERRFSEMARRYRAEALARLPLEEARIRASFVDAALREALGAFVASLPEPRVEALAEASLKRAAAFLDGKELRIRRRDLGPAAAARVVAAALPKARVVESSEDAGLPAAGIVAEAADGSASMRATLDLVAEALLGEMRGELAAALCAEALAV